jgi:hypothetical protein
VRSARVVLQAMLQGIIQGAGPIGCYYKVLTRCFVLGVLFFKSLFLGVLSWILVPGIIVSGVRVLGVMFTGRARRILLVLVIPGF